MKTVRLLRTGSHPVTDGLYEAVEAHFSALPQYEILEGDEGPADVVLAFMPSGDDLAGLQVERRTYQDFIGFFFIDKKVDADGEKVVRAYEIGLQIMANLAGYIELEGDGPYDYTMTLITPERGHEIVKGSPEAGAELSDTLVRRSDVVYVDENVVHADLPEDLWSGTDVTRAMQEMAVRLDSLDLVPSAVPLDGLSDKQKRRFFKVLGLKQVSYGNMSARHDAETFWMTGRGVNKAKLEVIGRDIILVSNFDRGEGKIHLSVPPGQDDARASIDSSIHAAIYEAFPEIGAMIHIHSFVDNVVYTDDHYPCGTRELCDSTIDALRLTEDPNRTILGLANHGILVTGADLEDAWDQIEARLSDLVPSGS
jgi:ribulose-5-phosphate 4-epimerase/fuculose-1-phosphate aldolase